MLAQAVNATTVKVGTLQYGFPEAKISLPTVQPIYALEGRTNNIYFRNVVRFDGDWSLITNTVTCAKGTQDSTHWVYVPTAGDAGTNTLTLTVRSLTSPQTLATVTCSLVTRALAYPSIAVSRKMILVGDSTSAGGEVSAQLINLFNGDAKYTFAEAGSNNGNVNDSGGVSRAVSLDSISGWTFGMFNTATTNTWTEIGGTSRTGSPFVFSGAFDFSTYMATNSIALVAGDWIVFNLGINYIFSATSDSDLAIRTAVELGALTNMISGIQAAIPGIKVGVALTIPPTESQAAFDSDYSGVQTLTRYRRNNHLFVESLLATFDAVNVPGVRVIPINANLDCANNMANGVHPTSTGYYHIADTYRAFLKGEE